VNQQAVGSREIYVIGNRQFVNANLAYHATDTTPYGPRTASAVPPEIELRSTTVQPFKTRCISNPPILTHKEEVALNKALCVTTPETQYK